MLNFKIVGLSNYIDSVVNIGDKNDCGRCSFGGKRLVLEMLSLS